MKRRLFAFSAGLLAVLALFAVTSSPVGDPLARPPAAEREQPSDRLPSAATEQPAPTGTDVARIVVPSLGIDAPIVTLGIDPNGTMQSPNTPTDVAWYSFSARPGERSNVVMSGHFDYINHGPAVFYRLKEARQGEEVRLVLEDGAIARYRVFEITSYEEATAPVLDIVGPTDREVVTLITCDGSFDPQSREYDKRIVLRAERINDTAQAN